MQEKNQKKLDFLRLEGYLKMVREIGFCQKAEPCCWPGLKNEKNGEMTAKLGGVTADAEIHHFEPAVNSNLKNDRFSRKTAFFTKMLYFS